MANTKPEDKFSPKDIALFVSANNSSTSVGLAGSSQPSESPAELAPAALRAAVADENVCSSSQGQQGTIREKNTSPIPKRQQTTKASQTVLQRQQRRGKNDSDAFFAAGTLGTSLGFIGAGIGGMIVGTITTGVGIGLILLGVAILALIGLFVYCASRKKEETSVLMKPSPVAG